MNIDETLHRMRMLTFRYEPGSMERRKAEEGVSSLYWYINTGRASTEFCKALVSFKGNQRAALLRRLIKADYTTEAHIEAAKAYIKAHK